MNPLSWVLILMGVLFAVIGFSNRQDNFLSAVAGKPVGSPTLK